MKIIFIKVLVGILFGVAFGLISVPLSKKLILSRSEDPGDVIVLRKKSTYILTALAGAVSAVGFILTADDETVLIRNLALLLPMLAIAIVDSLIRKIPNSLLLVMIMYIGCYLQVMMIVGILVLAVYIILKATKRGGMKTLIPMGPFISASTVISMCFPVLNSLVVLENMF